MSRYEIKNLIPVWRIPELRARIGARMHMDPYGNNGIYDVHSVYFDSFDLACYREKMDGLVNRRKVRIRHYQEQKGPFFLEIKERRNQQILKYKYGLEGDVQSRVLQGAMLMEDNSVKAVRIYNGEVRRLGIHPTATVSYKREAYISNGPGRLRITFDTNVRVSPYEGLGKISPVAQPILPTHAAVVEFKFNAVMPQWLHRLIKEFSLSCRSVSKYCLGVERLLRYGTIGPMRMGMN